MRRRFRGFRVPDNLNHNHYIVLSLKSFRGDYTMKTILTGLLILSMLILAGCSSETAVAPTPAPAAPPAVVEPAPGAEEVIEDKTVVIEDKPEEVKEDKTEEVIEEKTSETKTFNIVAKKFEFIPSRIEVNEGDTVILNVKSIDVRHGFGILAFGVNEKLEPGKEITVEFVADKKGTHSMVCTVFCGSGHSGMRGDLIVR